MENKKKISEQPGRQNKKRRIWTVVFVIAIAVICITVVAIRQMAQPATQPVLISQEPATPTISQAVEPASPVERVMLPSMAGLYEQNNDLAGWVKIEGTPVDYPVMYTPEDGQYYLYRTFEKENDPTQQGSIFIDQNCTLDPRSTNLLLHGHNMRNGTMFHTLIDYKDETFFEEHPTVQYNTLYEEQEYEIFAVFLSKVYKKSETDVFKFYQFYNADNEEEFNEFVQNCKELSLYETGITPVYGDELLTLSTCEYSQKNGRIVVVARRKTE